jgi:hypothetical protein
VEHVLSERTYYEVLGITRRASLAEVESAYRSKLKDQARGGKHPDIDELERAYKTLRDPNLKRKYDHSLGEYHGVARVDTRSLAEPVPQPQPEPSKTAAKKRPRKPGVSARLIAAGILIAVALGALAGLYWKFGFLLRDYSVGSRLVDKTTYHPVGTIVAKEEKHVFPDGVESPAYEVRLESDDTLVWYSKAEVNQLYKVTK